MESTPQPIRNPLPIQIWFFGCLAVIVLAAILETHGGREVFWPGTSQALPETCASRWRLGMDCPGCGLTRSFILLAHGDITGAWRLHSVGVLLFGYVLAQLPLSLAHWCGWQHRGLRIWTRANEVAIIVLAVLLAVRWLWRLFLGELW